MTGAAADNKQRVLDHWEGDFPRVVEGIADDFGMDGQDPPAFCSGQGQYHSTKHETMPQKYLTITLDQIRRLLQRPQSVPKSDATWVIPSTLLSRVHKEQRERGRFFFLWADLDHVTGRCFEDIVNLIDRLGFEAWIYTSRGATESVPKSRALLPLSEPIPGKLYVQMQRFLNDKIESLGLKPDRASQRAGQLCYLPNAGEFYRHAEVNDGKRLKPDAWSQALQSERRREEVAAQECTRRREEAESKGRERSPSSTITAWNEAHPVEMMLTEYGYQRRGERWLSPNSTSGVPGVSLTTDGKKWLSAHSSDADIGKTTKNGTMGDSFDLFVHYEHGGDKDAARRQAADQLYFDDGGPAEDEWPELLPLGPEDPPPLPIDLWPPVLRDYAKGAAAETETPVELPALMALGCVAASIQRVVKVEVKPGYREPTGLFLCVVLPPATRKSAEVQRAAKPLICWESEQQKRLTLQIDAAESLLATHKARVAELRKKAARTIDNAKAADLAAELSKLETAAPTVPIPPRIFTSDVTPEHLATMMDHNGGALAVISAEGGIFETIAGRYSNQIPNLDIYLMGHAGDVVRVDRGSRQSVMIDDPRLTMVLTVQPDVVAALSTKPGFRGRGFLGRVLFCSPIPTVGRRCGDTTPLDAKVQAAYDSTITVLLNVSHTSDPCILQLEPSAFDAWRVFWREVEPELADGGAYGHMSDWAGKLAGAVARIAALFHSVRYPQALATRKVSAEDMHAAIETGRTLAGHALTTFGQMGADQAMEDARLLLRWIRRRKQAEFTARDAHRNYGNRFAKAADLKPGFKLLEDGGYIRKREMEPAQKAGRPPTYFEVNPAAF